MPAPTRTPRSKWISEAQAAFATGGPEAVRVEVLAAKLGVSRGGFYWHFKDRDALLEEMLEAWEKASVDDVLEKVQELDGDNRRRLRHAGALTFSDELLEVDLAVRAWARRDPAVAERLGRVDTRRMDYLRAEFREICDDEREVEARSLIAFSLMIGSHFLATDHGTLSREEALDAATELLFG